MSNDLSLKGKNPPKQDSLSPSILQQGQKNMFIQNAEKVNINISPEALAAILAHKSLNLKSTYYNLIVSNELNLDAPSAEFKIDRSRVLTEFIDAEINKQFSLSLEDSIQKLQTLPTIFINENSEYGAATPAQQAGLGYISKIKVRHEVVLITPSIHQKFHQQTLNENPLKFDIIAQNRFSELNRTHWTIKKVDLLSELRELGISV